MARTVVLLDKTGTQVTNSTAVSLEFPAGGDMKTVCPTIEWEGKDYAYFDHPVDESDARDAELYRYKAAA
jgi:hypothetical protein